MCLFFLCMYALLYMCFCYVILFCVCFLLLYIPMYILSSSDLPFFSLACLWCTCMFIIVVSLRFGVHTFLPHKYFEISDGDSSLVIIM